MHWNTRLIADYSYSSRRALRFEQGNGLKCTESYSQNREGVYMQSLKCTFKCSQAEPMQGNANQCCKKEERWKLVETAGNMKGGQRGLWKAHLDLLWLKVWAQSKVSDPLVDCDPLDCGAFKQKSQVLRLLVRSRSDQVRAMTNTMQSRYLAKTFNLKVLHLNLPRGW